MLFGQLEVTKQRQLLTNDGDLLYEETKRGCLELYRLSVSIQMRRSKRLAQQQQQQQQQQSGGASASAVAGAFSSSTPAEPSSPSSSSSSSSSLEVHARETYALANRVTEQFRCCAAVCTDPAVLASLDPKDRDELLRNSNGGALGIRCTQTRKGHGPPQPFARVGAGVVVVVVHLGVVRVDHKGAAAVGRRVRGPAAAARQGELGR